MAPSRRGVRRGEVYVVDPSGHGGTLLKPRPVVVIQDDIANERSNQTIIAAIRDPHGKQLPVFVDVPKGTAGLMKDSVVDAGHILTVRQESLGSRIGALPPALMKRLDAALVRALGLVGWLPSESLI